MGTSQTIANCRESAAIDKENKSRSEITPYPCIVIDADVAHFIRAIFLSLSSIPRNYLRDADRSSSINDIKNLFCPRHNKNPAIVLLSVRTAWDLLLRTLAFPPGSEIVMTAINIPGMIEIVKAHGLRPIPWDIESSTLAPCGALSLQKLITPRTVAVLIAHLFGRWVDTSPYVSVCEKHGLYLFEDCAEVFDGFEYLGNPSCDAAFFSFGVIKPYTCFGGAVMKIRDIALYEKVYAYHASYPVQPDGNYAAKALKYCALSLVLNHPAITRAGMTVTRAIDFDHKGFAVQLLRGFPTNMITQIRQQPCAALCTFMSERFRTVSKQVFDHTLAKGNYVVDHLPDTVAVPGIEASRRNFWLFPVIVQDPNLVVVKLNQLGVDAYRGTTQLALIAAPSRVPLAAELMDHIIYLPVQKNVPYAVLDHIVKCVESVVKKEQGCVKNKL